VSIRKFRSALSLIGLLLASLPLITVTSHAVDPTIVTSTGGTATYNATTGHYYEYVGQAVDFATAKSAAEAVASLAKL
jgi:hypothetical protein